MVQPFGSSWSSSSATRLTSLFPPARESRWGLFAVLGGILTGLTTALILYGFGTGSLLALGSSAVVAAWVLFHPSSLPFFLLVVFVAAACPYLKFGGATDAVRWIVLAAAAYTLGIRFLLERLRLGLRSEHVAALFFCLWALLTTTYSPLPQLSFLKAGALIALMAFCYLYAERFPDKPWKSTESFFWSLVLIDALVIPASLALHLTGREFVRGMAYGADPGAFYGLFGNPNALGNFVAFLLPVLAWGLERVPRWRTPLALLAFLNLYCLWASRSRAAYAAAFAGLLLYLFFRKRKLFFASLAVVVIGGALYLSMAPPATEEWTDVYVYKGREAILESRLDHWKESLGYIRQHWILGYGLGTSPGTPQDWALSVSAWRALRVRGSSFLAVWEETGLPGVFLLSLLFLTLMSRAIRRLRESPYAKAPGSSRLLALSAAVSVGLVNMVFEEWVLAPGYFGTVFFWIFTFLLTSELSHAQPASRGLPRAGGNDSGLAPHPGG